MAKKEPKVISPVDDGKTKLDPIVDRAKELFQEVEARESTQRLDELDDIRFSGLLEQWPEPIRSIRMGDPTGARPCLVVDKVNQYKNQIVNSMRMNRPSIKVRPVDDKGDVEVADVLQGIVRHIEDVSKADIAYDWAGEGAVTSGIGFIRVRTQYIGDSFDQDICIDRVVNRFSVYPGKYSQPDGSDMKECLITDMVNKKQFEAEYPDSDTANYITTTGDDTLWMTDKEIRIAEYYYIEKKADQILFLESGDSIFKSEYDEKYTEQANVTAQEIAQGLEPTNPPPQVVKSRKGYKSIVKWCKLTMGEVLEETIIPGEFIPIIPVHGIETQVDGQRYLRGIIRGAKDPQRLYNYNRSVMAESLNLSSKAPWVGALGQFDSKGGDWAASNRMNIPYLEYDPVTVAGNLAPAPQRQGFAGVPTGLLQDIETSEHDIQASLGMYQASIGQDGNAKSGKALNAQARQGDIATFQFPDNQNKSVRQVGRVVIGMIPEVYDTARVVRILGEDGTPDYAQTDPKQTEAIKKVPDESGAIKKIYNLNVGKYDVTVTTGPSFSTKRQEGAEFLTQVAQTSPDLMPIIGDLLFKSLDQPYAEEISKRMKKMLPPELQDEGNGDESPEVMQVKQQAKQAVDELTKQLDAAHAAMQEADQEAKALKDKAMTAEGKLAYDNKKLEIEAYSAQTDRLAVEITMIKDATLEQLTMHESAIARLIDLIAPAPDVGEPEIPQETPEQPQPASAGFSLPEEGIPQ
jgi:portal protein